MLSSVRVSRRLVACGLAAVFALVSTYTLLGNSSLKVIHTEPSAYSPVVVFEEYGERCLNFETPHDDGRQTCMDLKEPDKLVFSYTRTMMAALFLQPEPRNILIVGLGGGSLQRALAKALPATQIDTVEIDPAVSRVAQRFFGYKPDDRQRVFIDDGRAFIEQAHRDGRQYDIIMLDAFDVGYIPPHLLTREFLQHVRAVMAPRGVLVANTFSRSTVYDQESATYADVFGDFFNLRGANRVIIATNDTLPPTAELERNARSLESTLQPFGVDVDRLQAMFTTERDWDEKAAVLTD